MMPSRFQSYKSFFKQLTLAVVLLTTLPILMGAKKEYTVPVEGLDSALRKPHRIPIKRMFPDKPKFATLKKSPDRTYTMDRPKPLKRQTWWTIPKELKNKAFACQFNKQHVIVVDKEKGGALVAQWMIDQLNEREARNLPTTFGLATGSSPIPVYENLVKAFREQKFKTDNLSTINLDEYIGLEPGDSNSYKQFMRQHLIADLELTDDQFHIFDSQAQSENDPEIQRLQKLLTQNPRHFQLLGIGENGHIGFNEPDDTLSAETPTRIVKLTESTRKANAPYFGGDTTKVPTHARTLGPKDILHAERIVVLAWGEKKKAAIANSILGPIKPQVPASLLQKHLNVVWVMDAEAAATLFKQGGRVTREMARQFPTLFQTPEK
ncbi:glucosamine-6-phosphate deaminase [Sansalvadorimonas verongulae]|uniref:glucosamine-6-phosphate deaminase n=1 Tax=Sansalvadorimonas verongulae TaxID=2172824 RepID=UPI0012BBAB77|nr:glucosamine-6-phosphate deaminase [Sansalvadorimonas verongulae]MTI13779.1 glucosamine-6-phosphate deaminase [Sansalvadorimonas verongulae]